jgi:hypothetical protein
MWVKARGGKVSWKDAVEGAADCRVGDYRDWRMPAIKELYSLIQFNGQTGQTAEQCVPYLDTRYFDLAFGDVSKGERIIDAQDWSANRYVFNAMRNMEIVFGVNFVDGRIKGYPVMEPRNGSPHPLYVRYVRGNPSYGKNNFEVDAVDGVVTDDATGLMWDRDDSGRGMDWKAALAWVAERNAAGYKGHSDWRLPNAKELQSIVDYTRSPDTTNSAAIDPVFRCTAIRNEGGNEDYPFYWTGTTHLEGGAVYVSFGRALGFMQNPRGGGYELMDVHGAGAQRSDPKSGDASLFPNGRGPQGDVVRIKNYVRCVRGGADRVVEAKAPDASGRYEPRSNGGAKRGEFSGTGSPMGVDRGSRRQPPAEAIAACKGRSEGESASFTTLRGETLSCHCRQVDGVLVAVPD